MMWAHRGSGLSPFLPLLSCETVSSLILDFWKPKSIETVSAKWRRGLL